MSSQPSTATLWRVRRWGGLLALAALLLACWTAGEAATQKGRTEEADETGPVKSIKDKPTPADEEVIRSGPPGAAPHAVLRVGVRRRPKYFSPAWATTDAERQ